jgi:hypothetical protein
MLVRAFAFFKGNAHNINQTQTKTLRKDQEAFAFLTF